MDLDAWVLFARRYGLDTWAALALDALGPLAPIGAQAVYSLGPVLGLRRSTADSLGRVLEDEAAREALRRRLVEGPPA